MCVGGDGEAKNRIPKNSIGIRKLKITTPPESH